MVRRLPSISRAYALSFIRLRSGFGPVAKGTPALCVSTCRIVVRSLPWLV
jgi:hypothetical protein